MSHDLLVVTKLSRPRATRWHLPRKHLSDMLQAGTTRRLTALIAAAGHGKTSTLAHFLNGTDLRYLWLQLDADDSKITTFLRYLALGVARDLGGGTRTLTALDCGGTLQNALALLVNDLQDCTIPAVIVLDDFHLIDRESPVVQLVANLLQYAHEGVHFYICSRTPLPFSIARMKVIQEACEITEDDLRFTRDEVQAFMEQMADMRLNTEQLNQICHLTEGWSAALVLLAAGLKRRGSPSSLLEGQLPADLFSYLADEVFHGLSPGVQRIMEETSILEDCSPQTCDALLGRKDSATVLTSLLTANLLVTQLGPDSFRYHHLLQRFLQERLKMRDGGESYRLLHKRMGDWYLKREMPEEAVRFYLRGDWHQDAAGLVEELAPLWLRTARLDRLRGLLAYLPVEVKERYPWMSLCEARHAVDTGHLEVAMGLTRMALNAFEDRQDLRGKVQATILVGDIYTHRQQYDAALTAYSEAVAALRPEYRYEEGLVLQRRATLTLLTKGATLAVEDDLRRALSIYVELADLPGEASVSNLLGIVRANRGDYLSAISSLERGTELLKSLGDPPQEVGTNLAVVYTEVGRFADATRISEPMLASSSRKMQRAHAALTLIHTYTRMGDFAKATALAKTANALIEELGHRELRATLTFELSALYRLSGQSQASIPYANEAMQLAKQTERANFHVKPVMEAVLLHLFHTGNAAAASRSAGRALDRLSDEESNVYERMMLTLMLALAEFRQSRTESRPEAVRILQEGMAECRRRGYEFFALHEWPFALAVTVYGLAFGVQTDLCLDLIRLMDGQLPPLILRAGIPLAESDAKLVPAAWQALPDDESRTAFSRLLTSADRRRVVSLTTGPAPLRIQCLGPLAVTVGAEIVDIKQLKKRKCSSLLTLLITSDSPLPREQAVDRLWPDLDPAAADTSLRVALHHLRRLLEPHLGGRSKSRYIQSESGLIWFSRQAEAQIDVDEFREALAKADQALDAGDQASASRILESACKLYRGDLSSDDPYTLEDLREALRGRYRKAVEWLGTYYWKEAHDHAKAMLAFRQLLTLDEAYEPAHQSLIRIFLENGQVAAARQQYAQCAHALQNQLGAPPSRATESLLQLALSMERETSAMTERKPSERKAARP